MSIVEVIQVAGLCLVPYWRFNLTRMFMLRNWIDWINETVCVQYDSHWLTRASGDLLPLVDGINKVESPKG